MAACINERDTRSDGPSFVHSVEDWQCRSNKDYYAVLPSEHLEELEDSRAIESADGAVNDAAVPPSRCTRTRALSGLLLVVAILAAVALWQMGQLNGVQTGSVASAGER